MRISVRSGRNTASVGSQWTVVISELKSAGTYFEAAQCLKEICRILDTIDSTDRNRFCKHDYDNALHMLMQNSHVWNNHLALEVITLNKQYFQFANHMDNLPIDLLREVLLFLPANSYGTLTCVSRDWYQVLIANEIWRYLFIMKFVITNPLQKLPQLPSTVTATTSTSTPTTPLAHSPRPVPGRTSGGGASTGSNGGLTGFGSNFLSRPKSSSSGTAIVSSPNVFRGYIDLYRQRLNDPVIGDKVEVAWRGKFRLETQDVYQGLAWWCAEIVDKHRTKYKIRYPGWESRWDEWVPKSRLRWSVRSNTIEQIYPGDTVELWCCGTNVPGAWLESKVKKVKKGKYCLGKVLSSGYLWIERDRLRLVKRGEYGQRKQEQQRKRAKSRRGAAGVGDGDIDENDADGEVEDEDENGEGGGRSGNGGGGLGQSLARLTGGLRDNRCIIC